MWELSCLQLMRKIRFNQARTKSRVAKKWGSHPSSWHREIIDWILIGGTSFIRFFFLYHRFLLPLLLSSWVFPCSRKRRSSDRESSISLCGSIKSGSEAVWVLVNWLGHFSWWEVSLDFSHLTISNSVTPFASFCFLIVLMANAEFIYSGSWSLTAV